MPPNEPKLSSILQFHPHPGPQPDPASLLQFFVDFEQGQRQQAFAAFLQLSVETFQAQLKFVQTLQKNIGQTGKAG
jgi:hypothetical protein